MQDIELRIMDEGFEQIAVIRDFSSLQWSQKYYEPGAFDVRVGLHYAHMLPSAHYVYRVGTDELGVIDVLKIDDGCMLRGRFAGAQLMERSINRRVTYTGTVEDVCREIVRTFCIQPDDPARAVPHLALGVHAGLGGEPITIQPYGKTVYDAVREVLTEAEMSMRLRYDFTQNLLLFEVCQGLDRTQNQADNEWCVFSSSTYNVTKEVFTRTLDTRNFAYVVNGDEDKNEDEWVIEIEIDDGRPRAEVWVQDNTRLTEEMTEAEFEAAVRQTGLNKLAEYNIADTIECEIAIHGGMPCGIGDLCTYTNAQLGLTFEQRVTEIREVREPDRVSTSVVLGKDELTEGRKIMRKVT